MSAVELINDARLLSLRPANVLARLNPAARVLPLSPRLLLAHLKAPLLEIPAALGPWLQPCLRAAAAADAPLCLRVEGEAAKGQPAGIHASVRWALEAALAVDFRRPLVLHARLGVFPVDDDDAVDQARVRVLEAVDAGATSAQLGGLGAPDAVAAFLVDVLAPLVQAELGVVVQLADAHQARALPDLLKGRLQVDAWTGTATCPSPCRAALGEAPHPPWVDAGDLLGATLRRTLEGHPQALAGTGALHAFWAGAEDAATRERLEVRLFEQVEETLRRLGALASAGHAMVALSVPEPPVPFE